MDSQLKLNQMYTLLQKEPDSSSRGLSFSPFSQKVESVRKYVVQYISWASEEEFKDFYSVYKNHIFNIVNVHLLNKAKECEKEEGCSVTGPTQYQLNIINCTAMRIDAIRELLLSDEGMSLSEQIITNDSLPLKAKELAHGICSAVFSLIALEKLVEIDTHFYQKDFDLQLVLYLLCEAWEYVSAAHVSFVQSKMESLMGVRGLLEGFEKNKPDFKSLGKLSSYNNTKASLKETLPKIAFYIWMKQKDSGEALLRGKYMVKFLQKFILFNYSELGVNRKAPTDDKIQEWLSGYKKNEREEKLLKEARHSRQYASGERGELDNKVDEILLSTSNELIELFCK